MIARIEDTTGRVSTELDRVAKVVNNGRTDDTNFYVSGNNVSVSNVYYKMDDKEARAELEWFMTGYFYMIIE